MQRITHRRLAAVAVVGALALAGCGSEEPAELDPADQSQSSQEDSSTKTDKAQDDQDTSDSSDSSGTPIGASWPDPDDVIAEDTFTVPGTDRQKVRIGIQSIAVHGDVMELRLLFTPEENVDSLRVMDVMKNSFSTVDIRLIDRENLKEYTVLESDGTGGDYKTSDQATAQLGETIGYQAFYAAPQDDIEKVDVILDEDLPPFEDVPLTFEE